MRKSEALNMLTFREVPLYLIGAFFAGLFLSLLIIRLGRMRGVRFYVLDFPHDKSRKLHEKATVRIGGLALILAIFLGEYFAQKISVFGLSSRVLVLLLFSLAVFLLGFCEDVTGRIGPKIRLLLISVVVYLALRVLDVSIIYIDFPLIDQFLVTYPFLSALFTIFAITGVTNAYNVVDGVNGLSASLSIASIIPLSILAGAHGMVDLQHFGYIVAAATLGFLIVNALSGKIFLGDGGAYVLGSLVAMFCVLVIGESGGKVSPWLVILLNAYPITETCFSIIRRIIQSKSVDRPDSDHPHILLHRFLKGKTASIHSDVFENSGAGVLILIPSVIFCLLGYCYRTQTEVLLLLYVLYVVLHTAAFFLLKITAPRC